MTQSDLGRKLGVSFQQVRKYECGSNALPLEKLLILASVLHVEPHTLWQGVHFGHELQPSLPPDRGIIALVRAYRRIRDPRMRQKLLDIVKQIAATAELADKSGLQ